MTKFKGITISQIEKMNKEYLADDKSRIIRNALTENSLEKISKTLQAKADNPDLFSIDIKTLPVSDQMHSGRCWIFSAMTLLREKLAKKYQMNMNEQFELSQNYIAFYDKLEKINYFMECLIAEKDQPLDQRVNHYLLQTAIGDGGQWDMMVSLVKKYGICPKTAMPETYQSSHTGKMNKILNKRLRKFACQIRQDRNNISNLKAECLKECYGLLCDCFGVPPKTFTFEYKDNKNKYHAYYDVTPLQLYKDYLAEDLDDYVGIINGPTADKPFYQTYTVKYLGNVADSANKVFFLNLPIADFKELILKQLKDQQLVWFGCDCGKDGDEGGLWDDQAFDYDNTLNMNLSMSKAEMLDTAESAMNHAMVFSGVNLVDGKPNRWKIENSWGEKAGKKGYYICSDTWFDKYVYETVVHKKYLNKKQLAALKKKTIELDPWDPFGSLA